MRQDLRDGVPGFQGVRMGFGLHAGWAVEGAIGSEYKIDPSYLSPHVNLASRLESATKQFGTSVLLSEDFVRLLSSGVRDKVRPRVFVRTCIGVRACAWVCVHASACMA